MKDGLALLATSAVILTVDIVHKRMRISVYPAMEIRPVTSVSAVLRTGSHLKIVLWSVLTESMLLDLQGHVHVMKDGLEQLATSSVILHVDIVLKMMRISVYPAMEIRQVTCVSSVSQTFSHLEIALLSA